MPFADVRNVRLYYELDGNRNGGRRLLFISGSGGDLRHAPGPASGPLGKDFEILAFDQRGLGQSDKPDCDYTMADYAADALALMDHVGWQSARVYGISFGGMVAQELAVTAPRRVEKLCLACTSPGGKGRASYPLHELLDLPKEEATQRRIEILDTRGEDAGPTLELIAEGIAARDAGPANPERDRGFRRQLEARRHHDVFDRLSRLDMPVLIAAGRYDGIAAPTNQEALHAAIKDSQLEWFEGGHVFMLQDPRANEVIQDFLR